jgi:hypothetical protein
MKTSMPGYRGKRVIFTGYWKVYVTRNGRYVKVIKNL